MNSRVQSILKIAVFSISFFAWFQSNIAFADTIVVTGRRPPEVYVEPEQCGWCNPTPSTEGGGGGGGVETINYAAVVVQPEDVRCGRYADVTSLSSQLEIRAAAVDAFSRALGRFPADQHAGILEANNGRTFTTTLADGGTVSYTISAQLRGLAPQLAGLSRRSGQIQPTNCGGRA